MTKYEDMSLEELEKEKATRDKSKLVANLKEQDKATQESADKKAKDELRDELKAELLKEQGKPENKDGKPEDPDTERKLLEESIKEQIFKDHPEWQPAEKIGAAGTEIKNTGDDGKMQSFYNGYKKRYNEFESKSGYVQNREKLDKLRFQVFQNGQYNECGFDGLFGNAVSDSGCDDDVRDWSPADTYAKIVWETFVCTADLINICVKGLAINPGDGLGVQVRTYAAFGDPAEKASCECGSCATIAFTTHPLTLKQYNLEAVICEKDIWDVGSILMDSYLKSMANSWAQWFDAQIYAALELATPGTTERLPQDLNCTPSLQTSCCSDISLINLYNAVHVIVATMRELTAPKNPDYLLISPTVAAIFKRMQTPTPMPWMGDVSFDDEGRMKKMGGLKVIEYCGANSCTDLASEVVAIVIDSRRAVGCVFGERPKTYKFFRTDCNSTRIDQWAFVAIGTLELASIGHVINAA